MDAGKTPAARYLRMRMHTPHRSRERSRSQPSVYAGLRMPWGRNGGAPFLPPPAPLVEYCAVTYWEYITYTTGIGISSRIEPEADDLPATSNTGQTNTNSGQIGTSAGQIGTDVPSAHVEKRTEPVTSSTSTGQPTAPIAPPQDLLYLAWAWPQLPEQMRAGIVAIVKGCLDSRDL